MDEGGGPSTAGTSNRGVCPGGEGDYSSDSDETPLIQSAEEEEAVDGSTRIDIPEDEIEREADPHLRFPKERGKTIFAFVMLLCAGISNDIVLSAVHEKMPDTDPLPDILFSLLPYWAYGLVVTEYIMLSSFISVLALILFHRHRWIVFRRLCIIGSLMYFGRCVTMFVTPVPKADPNYYCSPKMGENATFLKIVLRGLSAVTGLGLNINGKHILCGDYIYSGHTIVLVVSALFISQYTPRRWRLLHIASWLLSLTGMFLLIVSRGHYTIDVIISYFICTRFFYIYHTMASLPSLRISPQNHHRKEFWFPLFMMMEGRILRPLPRRYDSPFPVHKLLSLIRRKRNQR